MPKGLEINLEELKKLINDELKGLIGEIGFKKQPIAFGLNALDLSIVIEEEKGTEVENKLSSIKGVQSVIVQSVSLV